MDLNTLWFIAVAVLFAGYFMLEGFDFGVGMFLPFLGGVTKEEKAARRSAAIRAIGPVWDGMRSGSLPPATPSSPRFRSGTPRCFPAFTCRCCSSWFR